MNRSTEKAINQRRHYLPGDDLICTWIDSLVRDKKISSRNAGITRMFLIERRSFTSIGLVYGISISRCTQIVDNVVHKLRRMVYPITKEEK